MMTVRQLLEAKPRTDLHTISPDRTTYEALQMMATQDVGAVLVLSEGRLVGILTEREYARGIVLQGKKSRHTPVGETMCTRLIRISADTTLEECMEFMTDNRTRYLPVMDGERLVGMISIGDVLKNLLAEYRQNIAHLERYITGA
jgi:CBS domain-containing protein